MRTVLGRLAIVGVTVAAAATVGVLGPAVSSAVAANPAPGAGLTVINPVRLLDTRTGLGASGPVAAHGTISLQVAGQGGVPASAVESVVFTVTVTQPSAAGYLTVFPSVGARPVASNLNFVAGQTVANTVVVSGASGGVDFYNGSGGTVQIVADLTAYQYVPTGVPGPGDLVTGTEARALDTRVGLGGHGPVAPKATVRMQGEALGNLPPGVAAVVMNVTVTQATTGGYLAAYPTGSSRPGTSSLNFTAGQTVANLVIVPVSADGNVDLYNGSSGSVQIVADVFAYILPGPTVAPGAFLPTGPVRILNSGTSLGATGPLTGHHWVSLQVAGSGGIPNSGVGAVVVTVTVTKPTAGGFIRAYPDGVQPGSTSSLNFAAGQTVANTVVVKVGIDGKVALYNGGAGSLQIIADVTGYILSGTGITALSAGARHTLALQNDGTVWAWGKNDAGQLGDGTTTDRPTPVQVRGLTGVRAVAAGSVHSVALKQDGTVWVWGDNSYLGTGSPTPQLTTPVQMPGLSSIVAISASQDTSYAVKSDGTLWAWGTNVNGVLGDGTTSTRLVPVQVLDLTQVVSVSASAFHVIAVERDGSVWAWGDNSVGQQGNGTASPNPVLVPERVTSLSSVTAVSAGWDYSMAIKADGTLWAWGSNANGQLGNLASGYVPAIVPGLSGVRSVAASQGATIAATSDGTVWAWGQNFDGQLGNGTTKGESSPMRVPGLDGASTVSEGAAFAVVARGNGFGTVWAWGVGVNDQIGDGAGLTRLTPSPVTTLTPVVQEVAGGDHAITVTGDGTVWSWGRNDYGQLGDDTGLNQSHPVRAVGLDSVISVAGSGYFNLAVRSDGTVWSWGLNGQGQLGNGTTTEQYVPLPVPGLSNVIAVATSDEHSVALKADGTVWTWGYNENGEIGDGTTTTRLTPTQVPGLTAVTAISAAGENTLALRSDGSVWAWGNNATGALGDGTTTNRLTPIHVQGLPTVTALAAGGTQSLVLAADNSVWGWGSNSGGQLGDGTTTNRLTPVQVQGLSNVRAISTALSSAAVEGDGSVWTWGWGAYGGLGNGIADVQPHPLPTAVSGLPLITSISASESGSMLSLATDATMNSWGHNDFGQIGDGTTTDQPAPVLINGP